MLKVGQDFADLEAYNFAIDQCCETLTWQKFGQLGTRQNSTTQNMGTFMQEKE